MVYTVDLFQERHHICLHQVLPHKLIIYHLAHHFWIPAAQINKLCANPIVK